VETKTREELTRILVASATWAAKDPKAGRVSTLTEAYPRSLRGVTTIPVTATTLAQCGGGFALVATPAPVVCGPAEEVKTGPPPPPPVPATSSPSLMQRQMQRLQQQHARQQQHLKVLQP